MLSVWQSASEPVFARDLVRRLGDHRPRRAVDDRSAFFPRDRGWHHDPTDGKIQCGGLDLPALFRVGHGAGSTDRYSRRLALMARIKSVGKIFGMWVNIFVSAPISALVPIFMSVLGIGETTVVAKVFLFAVFVIILDTRVGIEQADRSLVEMARCFGADTAPTLYENSFLERPAARFSPAYGSESSAASKASLLASLSSRDYRRGRIIRTLFAKFSHGRILGSRGDRFYVRVCGLRGRRFRRAAR